MKRNTIALSSFLMLLILVQLISCDKHKKLKSRNLKSQVHKKSQVTSGSNQQYESIWKTLFNGTRGQSCQGVLLRQKVMAAAQQAAEESLLGVKSKKGKFAWVKNWGYGPLAYVLDFLDTVLLDDMLGEFHKIYDEMRKLSSADTKDYKDPFDLKKLLAASNDKQMNEKAMKDLKLLNKNYEAAIYDVSVNTVQIRQAMMEWKWAIDFAGTDFPQLFVKNYDINGDGRLNPRELILGAIDHNKHLFGSQSCSHCFENVIKKIDAIFTYIDCDNDGIITAEDLWRNLPKLRRSSPQYNMFALGDDAGIRTASVNDFVLMNMKSRSGVLNKIEFRTGIIFGTWDRQTDFYKIIDDDSRTLKELRWKDGNMVDIKAEDYIKEIKIREAKQNK